VVGTFVRAVGIAIAACLLCGGAAPAADKSPENARLLLAAVRANFDKWNTSHDVALTKAEIETDMQDPSVKGDAAAALAALKWGTKSVPEGQPPIAYSLADFDELEKALAAGDKPDKPYLLGILSRFMAARKKLQTESRELFSAGVPHLVAIRQDWDSDCYFNSAVGSLAQASPQSIAKLIQPNPDGTFMVAFPGKAAERIPAPTDAEIAAYTDAADGIWFNVLEKAYAKIRPISPKQATNEPIDAATLIGGNENAVMALVSGHPTKVTRFPLTSNQTADARFLQQVRLELAAAFHNHLAVVTAKFHHAYAVVAYDPRTDTITIHNPYDGNGSEGMPDGQSVPSSGGYFSLSTEKFVMNFKNMGVEQLAASSH
jgi:hypothetical protein